MLVHFAKNICMERKMDFIKDSERIYRLRVPFMSVYTSVFLVVAQGKVILVDCATTESDVRDIIVPALMRLGYSLTDVSAIVLTHGHSDHAGGLDTLLSLAPEIKVIRSETSLCDGISTYAMAGHTADSIGLLDETQGVLITGDGIQGAGIGKFRCMLETKEGYLGTLGRIRADGRIKTLLFSHEYEPWYKNRADGREQIEACIDECLKYL